MHMAVPNASQLENVQARRTCGVGGGRGRGRHLSGSQRAPPGTSRGGHNRRRRTLWNSTGLPDKIQDSNTARDILTLNFYLLFI